MTTLTSQKTDFTPAKNKEGCKTSVIQSSLFQQNNSLFTELVEDPPILVVHGKPLAVPWANVDVDGAEVVVLLMAWGSGPRHLHVELDRVHPHNGVSDMREEV